MLATDIPILLIPLWILLGLVVLLGILPAGALGSALDTARTVVQDASAPGYSGR